ncbi:MAG: aminoglycoside phosphotransferase family protein [Actinomycetota bacterium]|nr:aminoglycoside phosphotransferase family protein [Actinomycetota bacterium]
MSASAELPFVAAPPGDLESVTRSAELAAGNWGFAAPEFLRMGMNGIFAAGDGVLLRVSRPTAPPEQAIWLAGVLTRFGLRVPTYLRDQPFVTDDHAVFAIGAVVERGPVDWTAVGEMIARLHRLDRSEVAPGYPLPFCGDFPWWSFASMITEVGADLDSVSRGGIDAAIARCLPLLTEQRAISSLVCHGDVHPGNVIQSADGPVLLDWDLLCRGPAAWDHAPLLTWTQRWGGEPGIYEAFAEGYGSSLRGDAVAEAIAELRLVAATLMRVRAARASPSAADEAELRLRYWRGEADSPMWRAQ